MGLLSNFDKIQQIKYNETMGQLPAISSFKKGQKVIIGDKNGFGIRGVIVDIKPKDNLPIKVDVKLGPLYELSLSNYNVGWSLIE